MFNNKKDILCRKKTNISKTQNLSAFYRKYAMNGYMQNVHRSPMWATKQAEQIMLVMIYSACFTRANMNFTHYVNVIVGDIVSLRGVTSILILSEKDSRCIGIFWIELQLLDVVDI